MYKKQFFIAICLFLLSSFVAFAQQNTISIPNVSVAQGRSIDLPISMSNTADVVAVQFTIETPSGIFLDPASAVLSERSDGHSLTIKSIATNKYMAVIFSSQNAPIKGRSGKLISVTLSAASYLTEGSVHALTLSDVVISGNDGGNIMTGSEAGEVQIAQSPDIEVSNVTVSATETGPSGSLTVNWQVANIGGTDTGYGWNEYIYLDAPDGASKLVATIYHNESLAVGGAVSRSADVQLPEILEMNGNVNVRVRLSANSATKEPVGLEANNSATSAETIFLSKKLILAPAVANVEEANAGTLRFQLSRSGSMASDETFTIAASADARVEFPASVTIAAGQTGTFFYAQVVPNKRLDDASVVTATITGNDYEAVECTVNIEDDTRPSLLVVADADEIAEGGELVLTISTEHAPNVDTEIQLLANKSTRFVIPAAVVIPAGENSVNVTVTAVEDNIPDITHEVVITAAAAGYNNGFLYIDLTDNDIPNLQLQLSPNSVSEAAGPLAVSAKLRRLDNVDKAVTIKLSDNSNGGIYYSRQEFAMAAGVEEVVLNLGPIDNTIVDGDRDYYVYANVYIESCACNADASNTEGIVFAPLSIYDNDGPALTMSSSSSILKENGEITVSVSRNTETTLALAVSISCAESSSLEFPAMVTIPAGEASATFVVKYSENGTTDDGFTATLTASADNFSKGSVWFTVSDQTLPDAQISNITLSESEVAVDGTTTVNLTVANTGSYPLPELTSIKIYINNSYDAVATLYLKEALPAGETLSLSRAVNVPSAIGNYNVYAVINEEQKTSELAFVNNTSSMVQLKTVSPYSATINLNNNVFQLGDEVKITGKVNGTSASAQPIEVYVINDGYRHVISLTTAADGSFVTPYKPYDGQMGHFVVGACYPGENSTNSLASFDVYGIKRTSLSAITCHTLLNEKYSGTIGIVNPGNLSLSGVKVNVLSKPESCDFNISCPENIAADESVNISFDITAAALSGNDWEQIALEIVTNEGAQLPVTVYFHCKNAQGQLKASIARINTTMIKGTPRDYPFTLTNIGKGATGIITLELPSWITTVTPKNMSSIENGESAQVILRMMPTDDMSLNVPVQGTIGINCSNGDGLSLPFYIEPVSEQTGVLTVDVCDEYTYYTDEAPHVAGAKVEITHPTTGAKVATGVTDENGLFSVTLPEGYYSIYITADKHSSYRNNLLIDPGKENKTLVNLSVDAISIDWTVEEIEGGVEDEYELVTTVKYETQVPVPVVELSVPSKVAVEELSVGESLIFYAVATNRGLIIAEDVEIAMPTGYTTLKFEPLTHNEPFDLAPNQAVNVPIKVTRIGSASGSVGGGNGDGGGDGSGSGSDDGGGDGSGSGSDDDGGGDGSGSGSDDDGGGDGSGSGSDDDGGGDGSGSGSDDDGGGDGSGSGSDDGSDTGGSDDNGGNGGNDGDGGGSTGGGSTVVSEPCISRLGVLYYWRCGYDLIWHEYAVTVQLGTCRGTGLVSSAVSGGNIFYGPTGGGNYEPHKVDSTKNDKYTATERPIVPSTPPVKTEVATCSPCINNFMSKALDCALDLIPLYNKIKNGIECAESAYTLYKGVRSGSEAEPVMLAAMDAVSDCASVIVSLKKNPTTKEKMNAAMLSLINEMAQVISEMKEVEKTGNHVDWDTTIDHLSNITQAMSDILGANFDSWGDLFCPLKLLEPCEQPVPNDTIIPLPDDGTQPMQSKARLTRSISGSDTYPSYVKEYQRRVAACVLQHLAMLSIKYSFYGDAEWLFSELEQLNAFMYHLGEMQDEIFGIIPQPAVVGLVESRPDNISVDDAELFIERWNNTVIDSDSDNKMDVEFIEGCFELIIFLDAYIISEGYNGVGEFYKMAYTTLMEESQEGESSVCSSITLQFEQTMTMTRQAFRGTLTVYNGSNTTAMTDIKLSLKIADEEGNVATSHEFQVNPESLDGFTGNLNFTDGWALDASQTGVATIVFIPTKYAAPTVEKQYSFGGTLSYIDPYTGLSVTRNLSPVTLTVSPSPALDLTYFMQRDILGDDPLTEEVESSVEAEFSLLINNVGYGNAENVRMVTAQPEIIENEKGLLIDFELMSSQLNGGEKSLALGGSVATDFGTIAAQSTSYAQWWMKSSLLGHFTDYDVEATHVSSYGNQDLSLLNNVTIHELIRSVDIISDDKKMVGFLVNDIADAADTPDMIYLSNGQVESVSVASAVIEKNSNTQYALTVTPTAEGWVYGSVVDPTYGVAAIKSVVRVSDGKELPLRNFWQTDRTLRDGKEPLYESRIHFADELQSLTPQTYLLTFEAVASKMLAVESITGIPNEEPCLSAPVNSVDVIFNKPIDAATFTTDDLSISVQGKKLDASLIEITAVDETIYNLNFTELNKTAGNGYYNLTVQTADIMDTEGFYGNVGKSASWVMFVNAKVDVNVSVNNVKAGSFACTDANGSLAEIDEPVAYGTEFVAVAESKAGYEFSNWTVDGEIVSTAKEFSFVANANMKLVANFKALAYMMTIETTDGGAVAGASTGYYEYGKKLILTPLPDEDFKFVSWSVDGVVSTTANLDIEVNRPVVIKATFERAVYTQRFVLNPGWNWISTYMLAAVSVSDIANSANSVIGASGTLSGTDMLLAGAAYKVQAKSLFAVSYKGELYSSKKQSVILDAGWNWIAYPHNAAAPLNDVITNAEEGEFIVSQTGFSEYCNGAWIGTIENLVPSAGYLYRSLSAKELNFDFASASDNLDEQVENSVDIYKYPATMNVVAQIYKDGKLLPSGDWSVRAMCDEEVRGVSSCVGDNLYVTVYGNEAENILFVVEDCENSVSYLVNEQMNFASGVIGCNAAPFEIRVLPTTGIMLPKEDGATMSVYSVDGRLLKSDATIEYINKLQQGLYIVNGQKFYVK